MARSRTIIVGVLTAAAVVLTPGRAPAEDPAPTAPLYEITFPADVNVQAVAPTPDGERLIVATWDEAAPIGRIVRRWLPWVVAGAGGLVLLACALAALRRAMRPEPRGEPMCRRCRYQLTGSGAPACPECGADLGGSKAVREGRAWTRRCAGVLTVGALAAGVCAYAVLRPAGIRQAASGMPAWWSPEVAAWAKAEQIAWLTAQAERGSSLMVYDAASGRPVRRLMWTPQLLPLGYRPVFDRDGRRLATTDGAGGLRVFDIERGRLLHRLDGPPTRIGTKPMAHPGAWAHIAGFSADGGAVYATWFAGGAARLVGWPLDGARPDILHESEAPARWRLDSPRYMIVPGDGPARALHLPSSSGVLDDNVARRPTPMRIIALEAEAEDIVFEARISHESVPQMDERGERLVYSVQHRGFGVHRVRDGTLIANVTAGGRLGGLHRGVVMTGDGSFVAGLAGPRSVNAVRPGRGEPITLAQFPESLIFSGVELSRNGRTLVVRGFTTPAGAGRTLQGKSDRVLVYDLSRIGALWGGADGE